jgi:hypothetical protein
MNVYEQAPMIDDLAIILAVNSLGGWKRQSIAAPVRKGSSRRYLEEYVDLTGPPPRLLPDSHHQS